MGTHEAAQGCLSEVEPFLEVQGTSEALSRRECRAARPKAWHR